MENPTTTPAPAVRTRLARKAAIALFALAGTVGLTACDNMQGPNEQGDCHINKNYEITCDVDSGGGGLQTP